MSMSSSALRLANLDVSSYRKESWSISFSCLSLSAHVNSSSRTGEKEKTTNSSPEDNCCFFLLPSRCWNCQGNRKTSRPKGCLPLALMFFVFTSHDKKWLERNPLRISEVPQMYLRCNKNINQEKQNEK